MLFEKKAEINISHVITFLGIIGIAIGCISLFFYAVANNWISEMLRIAIGGIIGFALFGAGYALNKKSTIWANIMIGGAFLIEFISIGIGVLEFEIIPPTIGFMILTIFMALSIFLSVQFNSRMIAYYTIVGGHIVPFITNISSQISFTLLYILILNIALILISNKFNWADLRLTSFLFLLIIIMSNSVTFLKFEMPEILLLFLTLIFLIYNLSSIIFPLKNSAPINGVDIFILNANSFYYVLMIWFVTKMKYDISNYSFGLFIIGLSLFYLFEALFARGLTDKKNIIHNSVLISLISGAAIAINTGVYLILTNINLDYFMTLFAIEWVLFAYLSKIMDYKVFYSTLSYISLFLAGIWYIFILRFNLGLEHASFFMFLLFAILGGYIFLIKQDYHPNINGVLFIISSYLVIQSLAKYLLFFIESEIFYQMILSIMWLTFTIVMLIILFENSSAKYLLITFLVLIILKIAFVDLFILNGLYRIIGFIVLGIIMVIGGYFLSTQTKKLN